MVCTALTNVKACVHLICIEFRIEFELSEPVFLCALIVHVPMHKALKPNP